MEEPLKVKKAEGVYLYVEDSSGKEYKLLDSISSWWSVIYGYNNKILNQAISDQIDKFSHVMLGGLTHEPVEKLAVKLEQWLPGNLNHCFFSDSGSVGVEVALKMAMQFFFNKGEKEKARIVALKNAYHGDTFMAMETGDDPDYHFIMEMYGKSERVIHIDPEETQLEEVLKKYGSEICCFIVEPLLQGAAGMKMYSIEFLKRAKKLCAEYNILLIFDEVATGFGRTGYRFVSDVVEPDILVLGKALTAGYMGHSVTVASDRVFSGFYSDRQEDALMHGPTFMANPLACSVALKSIELFDQLNCMEKIAQLENIAREYLKNLESPKIKEVRIMGGCVCVEVNDEKDIRGYSEFARERGVFSRPFLKYIYTMVPYVVTEDEMIKILKPIKEWFKGDV